MLIVYRLVVALTLFVIFIPLSTAECPSGTRNNYKGECVSIVPSVDAISKPEPQRQEWVEPKNDTEKSTAEIISVEVEEIDTNNELEEENVGDDTRPVAQVEDDTEVRDSIDSDFEDIKAKDLIDALSMIRQLRSEIQDLLNRVELQRYELEKLRGRQGDLYDDLDYRMRKQERLTLVVPTPVTPSLESIGTLSEIDEVSVEPAPIIVRNSETYTAESAEVPVGASDVDTDDSPSVVSREPIPIIVGGDTDTSRSLDVREISLSDTRDEGSGKIVVQPNPVVIGTDLPATGWDDSSSVAMDLPEIETRSQVAIDTDEPEVGGLGGMEDMPEVAVTQGSDTAKSIATSFVDDKDSSVSFIGVDLSQSNPETKELDFLQERSGELSTKKIPADEGQQAPIITLRSSSPTAEAHQPSDILALRTTTVSLDEQTAYDHAFNMLKQSRYEDAAEEFAKFLRQYKSSQLTDDAWYWMAEAYYVTRNYEQALTAFNTVVSYFTNSPRIPASRLKIGYIQYEISDYISARETLATLLQDFPAHRVAVSAEARLKKMAREGR